LLSRSDIFQLDPARKINKEVAGQFRRLAESRKQHELENARMFLRAQREHKVLWAV